VLEEKPQPKLGPTTVMGNWDWEFYEKEHGKEATLQFHRTVDALDVFAKKQEWNTPFNLNKHYVGFKLGNKVVFGVYWAGTHAWHVRFKIPLETATNFQGNEWEFQRYEPNFQEALFRPKNHKKAEIGELEPLFVAAYKLVSGAK